MTDAQIQAVIRIVRLAIVAVIGVVIANITVLIGLIPDDNTKYLVGIIAIPLLDGIAKLIGGPTQAVQKQVGRGAGRLDAAEKPNFLSV